MADAKSTTTDPLTTTLVPPPAVEPDNVKAGDGEVVVTSPTGTKSAVEKHHTDALKSQGYKVS